MAKKKGTKKAGFVSGKGVKPSPQTNWRFMMDSTVDNPDMVSGKTTQRSEEKPYNRPKTTPQTHAIGLPTRKKTPKKK